MTEATIFTKNSFNNLLKLPFCLFTFFHRRLLGVSQVSSKVDASSARLNQFNVTVFDQNPKSQSSNSKQNPNYNIQWPKHSNGLPSCIEAVLFVLNLSLVIGIYLIFGFR